MEKQTTVFVEGGHLLQQVIEDYLSKGWLYKAHITLNVGWLIVFSRHYIPSNQFPVNV